MRDRASDNNAVKIKHMEIIIAEIRKKQAYDDGIDPDSVYCDVSTRWAKVTMVGVSVGWDHVSLTKNNIMIKTEA